MLPLIGKIQWVTTQSPFLHVLLAPFSACSSLNCEGRSVPSTGPCFSCGIVVGSGHNFWITAVCSQSVGLIYNKFVIAQGSNCLAAADPRQHRVIISAEEESCHAAMACPYFQRAFLAAILNPTFLPQSE